ncbi:MAG: DMT family transporter [Pyrinomonadaceae bacterium]
MKALYSTYFFIILAVVAGMMMPTQAGINSKLADYAGSPILAAFVSFVVGTVALFIYLIATGESLSDLASLKNASLISWTGGLLGAFFVASTVILVPRIGVALTFSLVVAGQMLITLLLDHYGFLGVPVREVNIQRVIGVSLVILGVILVRKF